MAKTLRKVTTALAVSAALLTARAATAADAPERATIVLHVDDFANLLPGDLNAAVNDRPPDLRRGWHSDSLAARPRAGAER